MMLSQIKNYLSTHKRAGIGELALHLDADPEAVRGMLAVWIERGRINRVDSSSGDCGGCSKCEAFNLEIYEWSA